MSQITRPDKPTVSVLLPVYNASPYVAEAIESVKRQTFDDFELLIVDDGSTDHSAEVIRRSITGDPRVQFWQQTNRGMPRTLNEMLEKARGRLVARIDADDFAMPTRLARQVQWLDGHPEVSVLGTAVTDVDEDGDPYGVTVHPTEHDQIVRQMLRGGGGIAHPSTMIRTEPMRAANGFALDVPVAEDQDLWLRMAMSGKLANLTDPLTRYRVHAQNMSFQRMTECASALAEVLRRAHASRDIPYQPPNRVVEAVSAWDRRRMWAWTALAQSHLPTASKHASRLVLQKPWKLDGWKLWWAVRLARRNRIDGREHAG